MSKLTGKCMLIFLTLFAVSSINAQESLGYQNGSSDTIRVPVFKSRVLELDRPAARISVGNPQIADILILRRRQLYILGKDVGTTNVLLWDSRDSLIRAINVSVTHDLEGLKSLLHSLLPGEPIEVRSALQSIVLSGSVSNLQNAQSAVAIAENFMRQAETIESGGGDQGRGQGAGQQEKPEIINMMTITGNHQVMLEVKVAELARTTLKRWQMRFNAVDYGSQRWTLGGVSGGATFPDAEFEPTAARAPIFGDGSGSLPLIGPVVDEIAPAEANISDTGLFASFLSSNFVFNALLDAARQNGLAKVLAEPTLTALSGQEAEFLSGGEFPIPVPTGLGEIGIVFKEFGVGLSFVPVVVDKGRINLQLSVSVSDLVSAEAVSFQPSSVSQGFFVPALSKRSASTTVELADGQTMGIAGLLSEDMRSIVNKFPGLGSIPILGHLFRSQEFIKGESELVILVTPHLARPLPPDRIELPTDNFVEPDDVEFYLMGRLEGRTPATTPGGAKTVTTKEKKDGAEGNFGHSID